MHITTRRVRPRNPSQYDRNGSIEVISMFISEFESKRAPQIRVRDALSS